MIETTRLILRPHTLDDFEPTYAMSADPAVMAYIGGGVPIAREEAWNRLLRYAGHWALLGYGLFAMVEKSTGRFLGHTGLADFHRGLGPQFDPYPEAAWVLAKAAHGQGFAREAVSAVHEWFDARRLAGRTVCIIHPDNAASIRLAVTLGYTTFAEVPYRDASVLMFERQAGVPLSAGEPGA